MINADNPENLQNPTEPTISKVYGFSSPVAPLVTNRAQPIQQQTETHTHNFQATLFHWWHKIALVLLTFHGLVGLWESFSFIIFEYKKLEGLLAIHEIESTEVNHLLARAIITSITTIVAILFAIRLSKVKETTAHNIDLLVATFLIISTRYIQELLFQLDLLNYFLKFFS